MNNLKKLMLPIVLMFIVPVFAQAACHVITPNGSGSKTGADWNNAYADIPGSLVRGDTYYVATGNYGSAITFGTAASGTTLVTIKKASPTDNCTSTGWVASYGVGQAIYNSWQMQMSYLTINGSYNTGAAGSYGFNVNLSGSQGEALNFGTSSNIVVENVEMQGPGINYVYTTEGRGINIETGTVSNVDFTNDSIHDYETNISIFNASNITIENTNIYNSFAGNPEFVHPNVYQAGNDSGNMIFRNNNVYAWSTEGIMIWIVPSGNWYIYNNVWHDGAYGPYMRVLEAQDGVIGPIFMFNNTYVNMWLAVNTANSGSYSSSSLGENNIYWNVQGGTGLPNESNSLIGSGTSGTPFNNYSAEDYTLSSKSAAREAGANLTSNCSNAAETTLCKDLLGVARPASGAWDIGAYEYNSTGATAPNAPQNLQVVGVQ